jgi:glycosyltransferase involved in cell wall biosynthesis
MTFLEAMARGCCVLAYDGPTMNEYIEHRRNGLLFRDHPPRLATRLARRLRLAAPLPYEVTDEQPWREFAGAPLQELGDRAREDHVAGQARWCASLDAYAEFLTGW